MAIYGCDCVISLVTTGNCTLWKRAPTTSLCTIAATKIITRFFENHNLPISLCSLVKGGTEIGQAMSQRAFLYGINYYRSSSRTDLSRSIWKISVGIGGDNAIIVTENSNFYLASRVFLFAVAGTAGQRCTTTQRLIVQESVYDKLVSKFKKVYQGSSSSIFTTNPRTILK